MQPEKAQLNPVAVRHKIATMFSVNFLQNRPTPHRSIAFRSDIHQLS
jgi:hypothetical protein